MQNRSARNAELDFSTGVQRNESMKNSFLPLLMAALALSSCRKNANSPATADQIPNPAEAAAVGGSPATATTPTRGAPPPVGTANPSTEATSPAGKGGEPLQGEVHGFMTLQLDRFVQQNGRMPNSFSEFASARMDSVPFPPPGKKYAIDYVTRQVKIVRK